MATPERPGLLASRATAASLGNLPSRASLDWIPQPRQLQAAPTYPRAPTPSPLAPLPFPAKPTNVQCPAPLAQSLRAGCCTSPKPLPQAPLSGPQVQEGAVEGGEPSATLALPLMSRSPRVLGRSCSLQAFFFLLSLFKNIVLN